MEFASKSSSGGSCQCVGSGCLSPRAAHKSSIDGRIAGCRTLESQSKASREQCEADISMQRMQLVAYEERIGVLTKQLQTKASKEACPMCQNYESQVRACESASHKCVWRVSGHEFVSNRTGILRFLAPKPEKPGPVGHNFVSGQTYGRRSETTLALFSLFSIDPCPFSFFVLPAF